MLDGEVGLWVRDDVSNVDGELQDDHVEAQELVNHVVHGVHILSLDKRIATC